MCIACMGSRIQTKSETLDYRCKAIKYTMLSYGASEAWINKNKTSVNIKCTPTHKLTADEFREVFNVFIFKIGVDKWTIETCPDYFRVVIEK